MDGHLSVVLLGKVGVGKSASANTILGRKAFESRTDFESVTENVSVVTGTVFEKRVSVIDTPDILESEEQIGSFCQFFLHESSPALFLLVIKKGRFTEEDLEAVETAERVLGPQRQKNCFLLFTHGDELKRTLGHYINGSKKSALPQVVRRFSWRIHLFNNKDGGQEQVRELLLKSGHITTSAY